MAVMQAFEARRYGSPAWKWKFTGGLANLTVAVLAVVAGLFLHSMEDRAYLYAACLVCSAVVQLLAACRKTAIVYIQ